MREYADPVIDWLDNGRGILTHRLFRDVRDLLLFLENFGALTPTLFLVLRTASKRILHERPVNCRS